MLILKMLLTAVAAAGTSADYPWVGIYGQPKSGTTWLEVIVDEMIKAAGGSIDYRTRIGTVDTGLIHEHIGLGLPSSESPVTNKHSLPGVKGIAESIATCTPCGYQTVKECVDKGIDIWSEACMKQDEFMHVLPQQHRYVLILRDPRAVQLSYNHYVGKPATYNYVELTRKCAALVSVRYYWHDVLVRLTNPSLILFYEDLVANPIDEYYRLASFLELFLAPEVMLGVVKNTSAASLRAREAQHALPGPNRPGQDTEKVRSATPDAFRTEIPPNVLFNATAAMAPLLHPALRMKWLYNDLDARFLEIEHRP
jgi:hypothetical protein